MNCAYRREIFERYRYDPELGPNIRTGLRGGEDFELGWRTIRDGYQLRHVPAAHVEHPVKAERMTWRHVRRHGYVNGLEYARVLRKLGLPAPSLVRMKQRWAKRTYRRYLRAVFTPVAERARIFEMLAAKGMLDEIDRAERHHRRENGPGA